MAQLNHHDAILNTVYNFSYAADDLDFDLLTSLCIPNQKVVFDLSAHLGEYAPMELTPSELAESMLKGLSGFDATQHITANPVVTFDKSDQTKANVKAVGLAYHCIETDGVLESVTARSNLSYDLELFDDEWALRKVAVKRSIPLDNPKLYETAKKRAEAGEGRTAKGR